MIIDVRNLKRSGTSQCDFAFEYESNGSISEYYGTVLGGPVSVNVTCVLQGDDVYVDGTLKCKIVGECARCLGKAKYEFSEELSVTYVRSNPNEEEDEYLYSSGVVNLRQAVRDVFLSNCPPVIYCNENCKGLCPICGSNLNETDCNCK